MRLTGMVFCFLCMRCVAQGEGKVWTETGVKGSIIKNLDWGVEVTNRFGNEGLETFFPQLTFRYKLNKYLRPSIDYRLIFDKDEYTNYLTSHRLNFNLDGKYSLKRLVFSARCRYQYSFNGFSPTSGYDVEFDQAWRFKAQISYDLKGLPITPVSSIEYFYNPERSDVGQRFQRYRFYTGINVDVSDAHECSIGYLLDQQFNLPAAKTRHILTVGYTYSIGEKQKNKKEKKKSDSPQKTIRTL
jgi:hypothetical protein